MEILKFLVTDCPNERTLLHTLGNKDQPSRFRVDAPGYFGGLTQVTLRELVATDHHQVWAWGGQVSYRAWPMQRLWAWGLCHTKFRHGVFFVHIPLHLQDDEFGEEKTLKHLHPVELEIPEIINMVSLRDVDFRELARCSRSLEAGQRSGLSLERHVRGLEPINVELDTVEWTCEKWVFKGTAREFMVSRIVSGWFDDVGQHGTLADSSAGYELPYFALSRVCP